MIEGTASGDQAALSRWGTTVMFQNRATYPVLYLRVRKSRNDTIYSASEHSSAKISQSKFYRKRPQLAPSGETHHQHSPSFTEDPSTLNPSAFKMRALALQRDARLTTVVASTALQVLCLAALSRAASGDSSFESYGARRTVFYQDNFCRLEAFREYAYKARAVEPDGTVRRGKPLTLGMHAHVPLVMA